MENTKSVMELALEAVRTAIKGSKIVENAGSTGTSFFQGKDRLCKVLNTKKGLTLEINVVLPKALEEKFNLSLIPYAEAHKKHLGTMKYYGRNVEAKDLPLLAKEMVKAFKAEQAAKDGSKPEVEAAQ